MNSFIQDWVASSAREENGCLYVGDTPVMYDWEKPVMEFFADNLISCDCTLLEIGFGLGVFARAALDRGPKSHVIIEVHPELAQNARNWSAEYGLGIEIIEGKWQESIESIGTFDAIFYDSFSPEDTLLQDLDQFCSMSSSQILNSSGALGVFVAQPSIPDDMRYIFNKYFENVNVGKVDGLKPSLAARQNSFGETMTAPILRKAFNVSGQEMFNNMAD